MTVKKTEKEILTHNIEYIKTLIYDGKRRYFIIDEIERILDFISHNVSAQLYTLWKISTYLQSRGKDITESAILLNKGKKSLGIDDDKTNEILMLNDVKELSLIDRWVIDLYAQLKKSETNMEHQIPKKDIFITYSWDSEEHKTKVLSLTDHLRKKAFAAQIDRQKSQEETATDFTKMMHQAITDYQKVIIVLSQGYKKKADSFKGGVGTEYRLIINDIESNPNKYILITFDDITNEIFPSNFRGREVISIQSQKQLNLLYSKLKNEPILQFSEVALEQPIIEIEEIPDFEDYLNPEKVKEVRVINMAPTVYFHSRLTYGFPGVRDLRWFEGNIAIDGILRFFEEKPLYDEAKGHNVVRDPIWWFRGSSAYLVEKLHLLEDGKILMNSQELKIEKLGVYNGLKHWDNFIYVQCLPDQQTGLSEIIETEIESFVKNHNFYSELFGYSDGKIVTASEAEDGAAFIEGKYVKLAKPERRERFLTPYNFILAGKYSPANSTEGNSLTERHLNGILKGQSTLQDLIQEYNRLPRHSRDD